MLELSRNCFALVKNKDPTTPSNSKLKNPKHREYMFILMNLVYISSGLKEYKENLNIVFFFDLLVV